MAYKKDSKGRVLKPGFTQRKDGRYCYRYKNKDGKTISVYDRDLRELEKKVARLNRDLSDNIDVSTAEKMTLNELFDRYIESKKGIRESTRMNYTYLYDRFVRDDLGERKLANIRQSDIKNLYNELLDGTLVYGTLKILHNALHPAFEEAVTDLFIRINPTNGAMKAVAKTHETKQAKKFAMTQEEQAAFLAWARKSPD